MIDERAKTLARKAVYRALKRGQLTRPLFCEWCNYECKPHGHHENYYRQLEVIWLCDFCHMQRHIYHRDYPGLLEAYNEAVSVAKELLTTPLPRSNFL